MSEKGGYTYQTIEERRLERRRVRSLERKRERRGVIADKTEVLDPHWPDSDTITRAQVCEILGITDSPGLRNILLRHRDELLADGWNRQAGTFTRRAVLRMACMTRADKARTIVAAAGARIGAMEFNAAELPHLRHCQHTLERARSFADRLRDEDPAELWAELNTTDRYKLQSLVVALAAHIPLDQPNLTGWLTTLAVGGHNSDTCSHSAGLALLVPTRKTADAVPVSQLEGEAVCA